MTQSTLVYDTNFWGTEYRVPVGTNTTTSYTMFEYTAVAVMAGKGGAHVEIDANGDGTYETTGITLSEGQSYWSATNLVARRAGAFHGQPDPGELPHRRYQFRRPVRKPRRRAPAHQPVEQRLLHPRLDFNEHRLLVTRVFLFNPTGSAITVNWESRVGTAAKTTGTHFRPGQRQQFLHRRSGAAMRFYHSGGTAFYAFSATNSAGTSHRGHGNTDNATYDWGYPLVPANTLTSQLLVSYGKGSVGGTIAQEQLPGLDNANRQRRDRHHRLCRLQR